MLIISKNITIDDDEIEMHAIRAQGAGGQNVNKVSSAVHLRFDINKSSLPDLFKGRLLALNDYRVTKAGVVNIKAQRFRTQLQNKEDALSRLQTLIQSVLKSPKIRKPTKATKSSHIKRVDSKTKRGKIKLLRNRSTRDFE